MKTIVRLDNRMTFEIDPMSLEAKECSCYDAYCFSDLLPDVKYIEYTDWVVLRDGQSKRNLSTFAAQQQFTESSLSWSSKIV